MAEQLRAERYKVADLIAMVSDGKVRIPHFQRGLRWKQRDVVRLFESIYMGYPIGTLLLWVRPASAQKLTVGSITIDAPELRDAFWVVDGQQRLTALASSLLANTCVTADPRFDLGFDLTTAHFRTIRTHDPATVLPLRAAHELQKVLDWSRDRDLPPKLQDRAFRLADRLHNYEVPAYLVHSEDETVLQDMYDRSNTAGVRMHAAEVFRALSSTEGSDFDYASLERAVEDLGYGTLVGNNLMYCVLATQGPDVAREFRPEVARWGVDGAEQVFRATLAAIERTIVFLRDDADVPHLSLIPYQFQLVALVRFFSLYPTPEAGDIVLLRRWLWQSTGVGPNPRYGTVGTVRVSARAIDKDGPFQSVQRMLRLFKGGGEPLHVTNFRINSVASKVVGCVLAHLGPIDPTSNMPIDPGAVLAEGSAAFVPIFDRGVPPEFGTANRLLLGPEAAAGEELAVMLAEADEAVLTSLGIPLAARHLLDNDQVRFLELRQKLLEDEVQRFVASRADSERPIRPSIKSILGGTGEP